MGHLLGTAPAPAHPCLMSAPAAVRRTQHVMETIRNAAAHHHLAGFAIDSPHPDIRYPGRGIELNGWVIGQHGPAASVVATVNGSFEVGAPLDNRRPDVLADYPAYPWAVRSGFSFWVPIPPEGESWSIEVEVHLDNGSRIALASLSGEQIDETLSPQTGLRLVSAPDYVILGTQRGGTTSLFRYLGAHPNVSNPTTKELHFLTDRYIRGASWYLGHLPSALPPGNVTGEATPYALFHPRAPDRAREVAPQAKFIVLLRDPVDRALSHYQHERALGVELLSFADAIAAESSRLAGEAERLSSDPSYVSFNHKHFSYLARGDYVNQLTSWFGHFPRDQFLILKSEDLYHSPRGAMRRVFRFLGLRDIELAQYDVHNRSTDTEWDESLRAQLRAHFEPMNSRLNKYVDWPFLWP